MKMETIYYKRIDHAFKNAADASVSPLERAHNLMQAQFSLIMNPCFKVSPDQAETHKENLRFLAKAFDSDNPERDSMALQWIEGVIETIGHELRTESDPGLIARLESRQKNIRSLLDHLQGQNTSHP